MPRGMIGEVRAEPELEDWYAACTVKPDATRLGLVRTFITTMKQGGAWDKLDQVWLLAAHDEQASRVSLKQPSVVFSKTAYGTPTFVSDVGWHGGGGENMLRVSTAKHGAVFPKVGSTDYQVSAFVRGFAGADGGMAAGFDEDGGVNLAAIYPWSGSYEYFFYDAVAGWIVQSPTAGANLHQLFRNGNDIDLWVDATMIDTPYTGTPMSLGTDYEDTYSLGCGRQIDPGNEVRYCSVGARMSESVRAVENTAVKAYLAAVDA